MTSILSRYPEVAAYFTAVTVFLYWLTYGASRMFPDFRLRLPWGFIGMGIAILSSPLVAAFLFDNFQEAFFADVDWRFYFTGIGASIVGLFVAWQIQRVKDDADRSKQIDGHATEGGTSTPIESKKALTQSENVAAMSSRAPSSGSNEAPIPESSNIAAQDDWDTLAEYDLNIREAIEIVSPYGDAGLQELRRVFSVIQDRAQMPRIANEIAVKRRKTDLTLDEIRAKTVKYKISRKSDGQFAYKEYLFDSLEDAIEYADEIARREAL